MILTHSIQWRTVITLLVGVASLCMHTPAYAAATPHWVDDPVDCPRQDAQFLGQSCPFGQIMCGVDASDIPQCTTPATVVAPTSSATSNTEYSSSLGGGYVIDCFDQPLDSAAPYCDNNQAAWCNRDDTCYSTQFRDTTCTANSFGAFTCGNCHSGRQDCDTSTAVCEVVTGTTNYDNNGAGPTEDNTNYGASCSAACDSGYLDCNSNVGTGADGCEIEVSGVCGGASSNAIYGATCNGSEGSCGCSSGYLDCDADLTVSAGQCEVQVGGSCGGGSSNAIFGAACTGSEGTCGCSSGYLDCDADLTASAGQCEIQVGASCGTNAVYGSSCSGSDGDCACSATYYDCDGSGPDAGNGCEVQTNTSCTTAEGAVGTYSGCTCVPTKSYFETGTQSIYATSGGLLQGKNLGTGALIEMRNGSDAGFTVFNSGALQIGDFDDGSGTGAGTMRWTGTDFEGYNGSSWESLTSPADGVTQSSGDDRYVNVSGDTMTGDLVIGNNATLSVSGSIISEGNFFINHNNSAADAVLTFGNDVLAETLRFSDTTERFEFSDSVHVEEDLTASGGLVIEGTANIQGAASFGSTLGLNGVTYTFPSTDGADGAVLQTNGAGTLDWSLIGTGSLATRKKTLTLDLHDAQIVMDGSDNEVNVYATTETGSTSNIHHYFRTETGSGQMQDIDIRYKVQLPQDFVNFTSEANDLQFSYRTASGNASYNKLDILVEDDDGDDAFTAADGQGLVNTSWSYYFDEFDGGSFDPAAGEFIYVTVKSYASSSGTPYAGQLTFTYTAR